MLGNKPRGMAAGMRVKGKGSLPSHARLRLNLPVMGEMQNCYHSLSRHEEITHPNGKKITISYALRCTIKHKTGNKKPVHKDALGRRW